MRWLRAGSARAGVPLDALDRFSMPSTIFSSRRIFSSISLTRLSMRARLLDSASMNVCARADVNGRPAGRDAADHHRVLLLGDELVHVDHERLLLPKVDHVGQVLADLLSAPSPAALGAPP